MFEIELLNGPIELIGGPLDGQFVHLTNQKPYALQIIDFRYYAQEINYNPIVEYYLAPDNKYYFWE